jgi:hypothetical protein
MRLCTPYYLMATILVSTSPGWAQSGTLMATGTVTNPVIGTATPPPAGTVTNPVTGTATPPPAGTVTNPVTGTATNDRDFRQLSPGNQKIAQALFAAEHPVAGGATKLTLDQIAELKESAGWGKVFQQMKADGLIQARNLGRVVSAYEHTVHSAGSTGATGARTGGIAAAGRGGSVVITNGAGRSTLVTTSTHSSAGARFASAGTHHPGGGGGSATITTAAGSSPSAGGLAHGGGAAEHGAGHGR